MTRLYHTPLPNNDARRPDKAVSSTVEQAGLLDSGGVAVENVSTENVSTTIEGQIRWGRTLSKKVGTEIESLSESSITSLPLYDPETESLGRVRGYYELKEADVSPAKAGVEHVYEYTLTLNPKGTREDSRRAIRINPQEVDSVFPSDSTAQFLIPTAAEDVRWFTEADGTTPATNYETVTCEFGDAGYYDPAEVSADAPTLTYDLPLEEEGKVDLRVYDTHNKVKYNFDAEDNRVSQWTHIYHPGHEFDGVCVIDTGRFRLYLGGDIQTTYTSDVRTVEDGETFTVEDGESEEDGALVVEPTGQFTVEPDGEYRTTQGFTTRTDIASADWSEDRGLWVYDGLAKDTAWGLEAWSLERIGPARAVVKTRWSDGTDHQRLTALLERGQGGAVWHIPENESNDPPQELKDLIDPAGLTSGSLPFATQGLIDRAKLEE